MIIFHPSRIVFVFATALIFTACKKDINLKEPSLLADAQGNGKNAPQVLSTDVYVSGLDNPRGLKFGPDGKLYVAEAGNGVTALTGGRVSVVPEAGVRNTISTDLPKSNAEGSAVGPMDIAFVGSDLYVLADGGPSFGLPTTRPSGIYKVNGDGSTSLFSNLSEYQASNPVMNPPEDDFSPDGSWYNLVAVGRDLYAVDANHGEIVKVSATGAAKRFVDVSATLGHSVPTGLDYRGSFFLGNLGLFPVTPTASVYKINAAGKFQEVAGGFSAIVGVLVDQRSWMYVLELGEVPLPFGPNLGKIYAVSPAGEKSLLAENLTRPTAMTMGADGNLYVSTFGFANAPGTGQIVKITLK